MQASAQLSRTSPGTTLVTGETCPAPALRCAGSSDSLPAGKGGKGGGGEARERGGAVVRQGREEEAVVRREGEEGRG